MNLFVSNPLTFSFENTDREYYYNIKILSSKLYELRVGTESPKMSGNWQYNFVVYDVKDVEPKPQPVIDEDVMPWS